MEHPALSEAIFQSISDKVVYAYVPCPCCEGSGFCRVCGGWGYLPCNHINIQIERLRRGFNVFPVYT